MAAPAGGALHSSDSFDALWVSMGGGDTGRNKAVCLSIGLMPDGCSALLGELDCPDRPCQVLDARTTLTQFALLFGYRFEAFDYAIALKRGEFLASPSSTVPRASVALSKSLITLASGSGAEAVATDPRYRSKQSIWWHRDTRPPLNGRRTCSRPPAPPLERTGGTCDRYDGWRCTSFQTPPEHMPRALEYWSSELTAARSHREGTSPDRQCLGNLGSIRPTALVHTSCRVSTPQTVPATI